MKYIGAHVSTSGGVENAPLNAAAIGAKAFAMFTKNQRQWVQKPYTEKNIEEFKKNLEESGYTPDQVLPHDSYLINLATPDKEMRDKSLKAFIDEAHRCSQLGLTLLNFHPGAHLKKVTEDEAITLVAEALDQAAGEVEGVRFLVETTAGQGTNIGYTFEHVAAIMDRVREPERVGACMDTCHIFTAGYDLRTEETYEKTMEEFDKTVGFSRLYGVHLNDAKPEYASRVDRHHSLGEGNLGWKPFELIMKDSRFDSMPIILETPDPDIWAEEIERLYGVIQ